MVSTASISSTRSLRRFLARALPAAEPRPAAPADLPVPRPPTLPALPPATER
jgi:hypothetical protein